jgi:hypothetical protein
MHNRNGVVYRNRQEGGGVTLVPQGKNSGADGAGGQLLSAHISILLQSPWPTSTNPQSLAPNEGYHVVITIVCEQKEYRCCVYRGVG